MRELEAGFATPEPTTLLLFGTTAAGLGLARWRQRRREKSQGTGA
ncbi:MAG: PEP-CTERM sorting domain-containing protein [Candidatus Rokuibacteriota bacterium]